MRTFKCEDKGVYQNVNDRSPSHEERALDTPLSSTGGSPCWGIRSYRCDGICFTSIYEDMFLMHFSGHSSGLLSQTNAPIPPKRTGTLAP